MNQLIGNYILDVNRYFNPFTFVYTFSYVLIEELPDAMRSMDPVSYYVQAKDVSEVIHYHSMSTWASIQLIPTLSDTPIMSENLSKKKITSEEFELLKEQLINPLYPTIDYMRPIVLQELAEQKNTNIHVMLGDIELAILYDSDTHCIKIENQYFRNRKVFLSESQTIQTWTDELSTLTVLSLYCDCSSQSE